MNQRLSNWMRKHLTCGALAAAGLSLGLRGQAPAAAAGTAGTGWQISGELAQGVDSNILMALQNQQVDTTTQLQLGLARTWSGERWSFSASYDPAATAYATHPQLDFVANSYHQAWSYALGPHTQLSWGADAERYPARGGAPTGGLTALAAASNASQAMALDSVITGGSTNLLLTHQYNLHSSWTLGASGGLQDYSQDTSLLALGTPTFAGGAMVGTTHSVGVNLGWSHQVSAATSLQAGAGQSFMTYSNEGQQLSYTSLQGSVVQKIGSVLTLQFGGGPAWNRSHASLGGVNFSLPGTSYTANSSLTATSGHTQYGVSWSHSNQVGLMPGGLTTDLLALTYGTQWTPRWSGSVSVGQSRGTTAGAAAGALQDSAYASAQLVHRMAARWSLQASANYFNQAFPNGLGGTLPFRRLQASVGVSFQTGGAQ